MRQEGEKDVGVTEERSSTSCGALGRSRKVLSWKWVSRGATRHGRTKN